MLKLRCLLLAAFAAAPLLGVTPAIAGDATPYFSVGAGLNLLNDSNQGGSGINTDINFDRGPALNMAVGMDYASGLRGEIELSHRMNDVDSIGGTNGSGDLALSALMANVYYDFRTDSAYTPYVGLGLGGVYVNADGQSPVGSSRIDDHDTALGAQVIAGVMHSFDQNWSLTADYRFFATDDVNLTTDSGTAIDTGYRSHTFMIGLRYNFAAPKQPMVGEAMVQPVAAQPEPVPVVEPAPVAAVPAPEPKPVVVPRIYIVFFDWDKTDLTPNALNIIRNAAANAKAGGISHIEATGHADRSGSDAYNLKLSKRRALAVSAELERLGIGASTIGVAWKGERQPLVETADGVREPQNRRVEITFP